VWLLGDISWIGRIGEGRETRFAASLRSKMGSTEFGFPSIASQLPRGDVRSGKSNRGSTVWWKAGACCGRYRRSQVWARRSLSLPFVGLLAQVHTLFPNPNGLAPQGLRVSCPEETFAARKGISSYPFVGWLARELVRWSGAHSGRSLCGAGLLEYQIMGYARVCLGGYLCNTSRGCAVEKVETITQT
jgi:hypothetical protein